MAWTERYCSPAGGGAHDGTTAADAWTLAEAIAGVAAGHRVNMIAGTYANTTTDRTFATAGTTTAPIWWRGYASAIGDLDDVADGASSGPAVTFTTGRFLPTGSHQLFSSLSISGAQTTNGQVRTSTGAVIRFDRCRIECTAANANGRAVLIATADTVLSRCWLKATSSAPVMDMSGSRSAAVGCALEGGSGGIVVSGANNVLIAMTAFNNVGGDAISSSVTGWLVVLQNTIYSPASDGLEMTALPGGGLIAGNVFSECGGYGINNSSGANTNLLARMHNLFHGNTSGTETGFGDAPSLAQQTDSASPFTSAAGGDLSLISTSNAKANGPPKKFENQSYTSYLDVGAVQRQEAPEPRSLFRANIGTH